MRNILSDLKLSLGNLSYPWYFKNMSIIAHLCNKYSSTVESFTPLRFERDICVVLANFCSTFIYGVTYPLSCLWCFPRIEFFAMGTDYGSMLHCDVIGSQFETFRNNSVGCITGVRQVSGNCRSTFTFLLIIGISIFLTVFGFVSIILLTKVKFSCLYKSFQFCYFVNNI